MEELPSEVRASYIVIIDDILAKSDLQTISSKRIREGLQKAVDYDITPQKDAIKKIIMDRFDKFVAESKETTSNHHTEVTEHPSYKTELSSVAMSNAPSINTNNKSKVTSNEDDDDASSEKLSDATSTPPKKRKSIIDDDAAFAARLQAEENSRARPTRGGNVRKVSTIKKKKRRTAARVSANDDSEMSGSETGSKRKVNRSGGFHKPLVLSAPLSALLDGETQLSRPQTVKRIWEYVKERDLQDPKDKRHIRCDEALRAVFKTDRLHMFTLNKILATQLYDPDT